ncbi:MAG: methyltransferase domain-containing protein [Spirochaetota bacterium]
MNRESDAAYEVENPDTCLRSYQWQAVPKIVSYLSKGLSKKTWLDFGAGNGGLLTHLGKSHLELKLLAYEASASAAASQELVYTILGREELAQYYGRVGIISSLGYLQQLQEPEKAFAEIGRLLYPGGIFFYQVANSAKVSWESLREGSASLFTPQTMQEYLQAAGMQQQQFPLYAKYLFTGIVKHKILQGLGYKDRKIWHNFIPWSVIAHFANLKYGITELGYGIKQG